MKQYHKRLGVLVVILILTGLGGGRGWYNQKRRAAPPPAPLARSTAAQPSYLEIEKIGVIAPIILHVAGADEASYLKAIENGVAQYDGTALPGNPGNSVIFGHSSYYKNKPGNYKEVFLKIDQLRVGDRFSIRQGSTRWFYEVKRSEIIVDDDLSVLDPSSEEMVTLLTCWPPRTVEKRYVVQAKRVTDQSKTKQSSSIRVLN